MCKIIIQNFCHQGIASSTVQDKNPAASFAQSEVEREQPPPPQQSWQKEQCQAHGLEFLKFHGTWHSQPPVLLKPHYQKGENTSKKMGTACLSPVFSGDRP
jgi:hypothetical protein